MRRLIVSLTLISGLAGCGGSATDDQRGSAAGGAAGAGGGVAGAGGSASGGASAGGASGTSGAAGSGPTPTGKVAWSVRGDGLGTVYSVSAGTDGSVAVAGLFQDTIDFGAGPVTSAGGNDLFVARFDAQGACTWSRGFGGPGDDIANAVAMAPDGSVFVTGAFQGTLEADGQVLDSAGSYDVPLIALDAQGNVVRAERFGGPGSDVAFSLDVNEAGTLALLGSSDGPIDFGAGSLQGTEATFVAALTTGGEHVFSRMFDGVQGQALALDPTGHVAFGGDFSDVIDLGTGPLSSVASTDSFVARLDPSGTTLFAQRVGDGSSMSAYAVAVGAGSDIVLGGMAQSQGVSESFVELDRFSPAGDVVWSRQLGKAEYAAANAAAIDSADNVILAGFVRDGTLDLGCGPLQSPADSGNKYAGDMFLAKLDPAGACLWSHLFGGAGQQSAFGVAVDGQDDVVVGGEFQYGIDFGAGVLTATHYPEPCVARFAP
jgi:hypothetical protein